MGLASSLQIFNEGGRPVSRFAVNLAPMLEIPFATAADSAAGEIHEVPPRPGATVKKTVIFGAEWLRPARRSPLLLVLAVVDHYDNLPMLGTETPYLQLFRARGLPRTNPELLRSDPMVAVFGLDLTRRYESGGEIPPPLPRARAELAAGRMAWVNHDVGDTPARILYFRGADVIFALAQPHSSRLALLADYLRLFLLNLALAGLLVAGVWLARRVSRQRTPRAPAGSTFYGRLVTVVLITSLLPLLALASFFTQFSTRESERELTASGLSSLQVARRVAEDYLTVSGPEQDAALDDDVVFWLSRVVRQDINIYGQRAILATSTRELYTSGLLNQRLNGSVYRALYLEREPFVLTEERVGGLEHLSISAPMRIDREGTDGVISIPLAAHRRAVGRKVEEVEDAILISTCLTVLLLAGAGYAIARRVSDPVVQLARAARRVAEGDLDVRVTATARDETAILVEAFNRMAASLREQREDLRRRKEYIEKILSSATTGVVSIDAAGSIITINPAAQALLGSPGGPPAPGGDLQEMLDREAYLRPLGDSLRRSLAGRTDTEAELVLARGDSERRLRAVFIRFSPDEGAAPGRIILLEDVTEIVRSGRLAAWAEMARRIAHEIKNPLTPIQLSVEHVRRIWQAGDERFGTVLKDCLDNIQAQVRVLRQIASEFSAYARLPRLRAEPTAVSDLIEEAMGPYAAAAPPGVTLRRDVPRGLPAVLVDRAIIARALVNLIENALQAMPSGGTLGVAAAEHNGPEGGPRVRIEVNDTGVGIDPAALPHLFEPYFSTKSGGTGLGLAIARRAVEDHGGTIEIRSRPGEGTSVILILPAAPAATGAS
jgi:signal transduction histidine kinase